MRVDVFKVLFAVMCVATILLGLFLLLAALLGAYISWHEAFYTCDGMPSPPGALSYEAGFGGSSGQLFPVAGTVCTWNRADGSTFDTLVPNLHATIAGWAGIGALALGTAGPIAAIRRRYPTQAAQS